MQRGAPSLIDAIRVISDFLLMLRYGSFVSPRPCPGLRLSFLLHALSVCAIRGWFVGGRFAF